MRLKPQKGAWILGVLFLIGIIFPNISNASAVPGLARTVYNYRPNGYNQYNNAPPLPNITGISPTGSDTVSRVQDNFDQNPPFNLYEDFLVNYKGYITSPVSGSFIFWPQADDGTKLYVNNELIQNDWRDKGGGGAFSSYVTFEAGVSQEFEMWFYENGGGAWTTLYWDIGNGWEIVPDSAFTQTAATTTTTIPKYLGKPTNIVLTDTGSGIKIDWDPAQDNVNISPERYAISWSTDGSGWGIATGNVGDQNALNTEVTLSYAMFSSTGGLDAEYNITVRADNDTQGVYSQQSDPAVLKIGTNPTPPTTTTIATTTTTTPETTTTEPETVVPETTTTTTEPDPPSTTEPDSPSTTDVATDPNPTPETTAPDTLPDETETPANPEQETQPDNNETVEVTADNLAEVLSGEITSEEVGAVVDAITSGDVEITDEVADQLVDVLTSGEATEEQIVELVDALIEEEKIDPEVATELATSAEVLESITEEQATEIFAAIETSEITEEEKSEITEAVQNAPEEVKNAFEEEINIYADGFDDYVPVGSVIDVGTRRSLIAATTVLSTVAVAGASGGSSGGGGGSPSSRPSPSGGGSGGPDPNSAAKKEDEPEEEEEEAAEIEGPEGDEEENSFTRNSIYKYQEGTMKRTFNPWGFIKKFAKETAALAFTISGTVIVFATLSGETRKITLIATSCAFVVHYLNAMLKNDE